MTIRQLVVWSGRKPEHVLLQFAPELNNAQLLYATMLVILLIGIVVDVLFFGQIERTIRRRRGLLEET